MNNHSPIRVLVVDADAHTTGLLRSRLRGIGFEVFVVDSGRGAVRTALTVRPDAVLLDRVLPDCDGFELYGRLRAAGVTAPVVFLTACDSTTAKVQALMMGADDYVIKPFDPRELAARLQAMLRRRPVRRDSPRLRVADVELALGSREVWRGGVPVALSTREFDLLRLLMHNAGRAVTKEQILHRVWDDPLGSDLAVLRTYVYYLRRKLGDRRQALIRTVRDVGYMMPGQRTPSAPGAPASRGRS